MSKASGNSFSEGCGQLYGNPDTLRVFRVICHQNRLEIRIEYVIRHIENRLDRSGIGILKMAGRSTEKNS